MLKTVIALLAVSATPSLAQVASTVSTSPTGAASDKRSCRSLEATGSIMSTRVCHKHSEWAAIDSASQKTMDNRRNSNLVERSQGGTIVGGAHADSFGQ